MLHQLVRFCSPRIGPVVGITQPPDQVEGEPPSHLKKVKQMNVFLSSMGRLMPSARSRTTPPLAQW